MKTLKRAAGTVITAGFVAAMLGGSAQAQQKLSFSYNFGDKGAVADAMKWWANEVKTRTDGSVEVEIFWRNGLGVGFRNTFSAIQDGTADMGEIAPVFSAKETPAWALADTGERLRPFARQRTRSPERS